MPTRSEIVLAATLGLLKPIVRMLLRHGVAYPAFVAALKRVFIDEAQAQLNREGKALTDSAVSLRSGVHRRDIRNMTRLQSESLTNNQEPMNMAMQVVARWLSMPQYRDDQGHTLTLQRNEPHGGFDALVGSISSDVRPRAVLDDMLRLSIATETDGHIQLVADGFAPQQGFAEMLSLLEANIHDHLAAASSNLDDKTNFLEQSIFVDHITAQSARRLHAVSAKAWRQAFKTVMQEATARFDEDRKHARPEERTHRARFGSYFYAQAEEHDARNKNES